MKKIFILLSFFAVALTGCSGDQGPIGPEGPQGPPGPAGDGSGSTASALVFEVENVNLSYEADNNLWATRLTFNDFTTSEVFENDAILVYRLDGTVELNQGDPANSWSLLPQNFFLDAGTIQYVTTHTFLDTDILIDGDYDLTNLDSDYTSNQTFRIVIVRADVAAQYNGNYPDMNTLMTDLNIQNDQVEKLNL